MSVFIIRLVAAGDVVRTTPLLRRPWRRRIGWRPFSKVDL